MKKTCLQHNTYHHFLGEGESDSELDILLHKGSDETAEVSFQILCGKEDPLVISDHDLIISCVPLHCVNTEPISPRTPAPRVLG